jgi:RecB family endonuclease NucS
MPMGREHGSIVGSPSSVGYRTRPCPEQTATRTARQACPKRTVRFRFVRLIVARCSVTYTGRGSTHLPEAVRLLMLKGDGTFMIWSDGGGAKVKPLNWMTPPTVIEDGGDVLRIRKRAGKAEDRLEIRLFEVLSDVEHDMGEAASLEKDGVERDLQLELADIGPVDLMCTNDSGEWVAVEIKRIGTIDAVEQLTRYLERIRALDPAKAACRGILAAQLVKPQARKLAESREIDWIEVDLEALRGTREPELTLFTA